MVFDNAKKNAVEKAKSLVKKQNDNELTEEDTKDLFLEKKPYDFTENVKPEEKGLDLYKGLSTETKGNPNTAKTKKVYEMGNGEEPNDTINMGDNLPSTKVDSTGLSENGIKLEEVPHEESDVIDAEFTVTDAPEEKVKEETQEEQPTTETEKGKTDTININKTYKHKADPARTALQAMEDVGGMMGQLGEDIGSVSSGYDIGQDVAKVQHYSPQTLFRR